MSLSSQNEDFYLLRPPLCNADYRFHNEGIHRIRGRIHAQRVSKDHCVVSACELFQSTRPREARLVFLIDRVIFHHVSIHAPMWGATSGKEDRIYVPNVSIHAPMWGATLLTDERLLLSEFQSTRPCGARLKGSLTRRTRLSRFQSTRPCGARLGGNYRQASDSMVSIHAPMWGATTLRRNKRQV